MKKAIALIGESAPDEAVKKLEETFKVYVIPSDPLIAPQVCTHPDMILTLFDGKLFCHESYHRNNYSMVCEIACDAGLQIIPCECARSIKYPDDIAFNVLCAGDRLNGKTDSVAPDLRNYNVIDTRQGYAGCTSLFAGGHIISADPSILKSAETAGIPFFKIRGEGIKLPGYDTGFIGGACGVFEDKIYICGDPMTSDAGRDLLNFCKNASLDLVSLCSGAVTDIGGIKFTSFSVAK